jgi:hypothetical protein
MQTATGKAAFEVAFEQVPGVSASVSPTAWVKSNRLLGRFTQHHLHRLVLARRTAVNIRQELEALFPLIDKVSRATCPWCPDPCCVVTKVWYDFIDLLFFHLISLPLPPAPLADELEAPCRYLSPRGCRLSRLLRPWGCLQYTCPSQKRYLREHQPQDEARLDLALERVRTLRYQLADEFQHAVTSTSHSAISPPNIPPRVGGATGHQ